MSAKVNLIVVEGPMKGQRFEFEEHDTLIIGRQSDCQIRLRSDNLISRHHFLLEVSPPLIRLRDLGSHNGTYVNGVKYGGRRRRPTGPTDPDTAPIEVDLKDRDRIRAGRSSILVRVLLEGDTAPVCCAQCGLDATVEMGSAGSGVYICQACRKELEDDPLQLLLHKLPEFQIEGKLGSGSFGVVYLARRSSDGEQVAIKVMLSKLAVSSHSRKRFLREIDSMEGLRHENIVSLYEHGSAASAFYFVMEYCDGGSIKELMKRTGGKLSLEEGGNIMVDALRGLVWAHGQSFVHRDIKPQNVLLTTRPRSTSRGPDEAGLAAEGGGPPSALAGSEPSPTAKLADFGLAKNFQGAGFSGLTVTGSLAGTPPFMPREQLMNFKYVKPVSDVWSIGATFYAMLTGRFPKEFPRNRDPVETVLVGRVIPIRERDPALPDGVADVIDRALLEDMKLRYQTAEEMLKDLEAAL